MNAEQDEPPRKRYEAVLAASTAEVERFVAGMLGFLAGCGRPVPAFDLELLAREALLNAVVHGCVGDPQARIQASAVVMDGELVLRVADSGPGWDWRAGLAAAEGPDPAAEHGRGLYIIRRYADAFAFNDAGNALTIRKRLPREDSPMESTSVERMALGRRVSAQDVPQLREELRGRIQSGARQLVLDFGQVESLDSMGIGLLVATHNSLAKLGGSLSLVGVRREILQLLTLMRLDRHLTVTPAAAQEG